MRSSLARTMSLLLLVLVFLLSITALLFLRKELVEPRSSESQLPPRAEFEIIHGAHDGVARETRLRLAKDSVIDGDVSGKVVVVEGEVKGSITASQEVEIRAGAAVRGTITAPRIRVADGATIRLEQLSHT